MRPGFLPRDARMRLSGDFCAPARSEATVLQRVDALDLVQEEISVNVVVRGALVLAGVMGVTCTSLPMASAEGVDSYQVICVTKTVPTDPEPYQLCVYEPI